MYNIFISHAWKRSEHYKKIVKWLDDSDIEYKNYSVPEDDPLETKTKLNHQVV